MTGLPDRELCCGCGACADICPAEAIRMAEDREGFKYPETDRSKCVSCGKCREVCPVKKTPLPLSGRLYFGAQAKSEELRHSSSSGGMFSVLAEYVLRLGGAVYGAGYDEDMNVVHQEAGNLSQLEKLKKTKYVQSSMEGIYRRIETRLKDGRWVLFCGTPCQVYALRLFLKKPCDRLILVDVVCYGVGSPGLWSDYVKYLERRYGGKMEEFVFRDKRNRNNGHTRSCVVDGTEYVNALSMDDYCRMYFQNYILRPSCHKCKFCTAGRNSDFSIGDFWGIERLKKDMDDGMGTSLVIVHTDKAKAVWEKVKKDVRWFECGAEDLSQPRLCMPTAPAKRRRQFMLLYSVLPFPLLMKLMDIELKVKRFIK